MHLARVQMAPPVELRNLVSNPVANQPQIAKPAESDRRRSTRVLLVMPVEVKWMTKDGPWVQEHGETEVVSQHGAMLRMKSRISPGTVIEVRRPEVGTSAKAKVVGVGNPSPDGLARMAVEMTVANDSFWGVSFPPLAAQPANSTAKPSPLSPAKPASPAKGTSKLTPVTATR
jgi:hypothetical protein